MKVEGINFEDIEQVPLGTVLEEINEKQINQIVARFSLEEETLSNKYFFTTIGYDVVTVLLDQRDVKLFSKQDNSTKELILLYSSSLRQAVLTLIDK